MKKLILTVIPFLAINMMATEIKLDSKYAYALGNPFKAKIDTKSKSIKLNEIDSSLIKLKVISNIRENSLIPTSSQEFYINQNQCNTILAKYLSEDFSIQDIAKTEISCKILPSTINLDYYQERESMVNILRDVNMDTNIELFIKTANTIKSKILNIRMNKDLGINGNEYDWTIRFTFNFEHENLDESIHKIFEYSIFSMLNKELQNQKDTF